MDFSHSEKIYSTNTENSHWTLLQKIRLDTLKPATKKVAHKSAEATGEIIGNKIAKISVTPKPLPGENSRNVEEIIISPEKREEILNEFRQVL